MIAIQKGKINLTRALIINSISSNMDINIANHVRKIVTALTIYIYIYTKIRMDIQQ
jgi:hypothetical protein